MKLKMIMKNRSDRYDINRPRHNHKLSWLITASGLMSDLQIYGHTSKPLGKDLDNRPRV